MLNLWQNKRKGDCPFFLILWFYGCNSMINALVYPFFGDVRSQIFPPCISTILQAMLKPSPLPPLVLLALSPLEKGSKICSANSGSMFLPVSAIQILYSSSSVTLTFVPTSLYFRALLRILVITLVIWLLSSSMESSLSGISISSSMPFSSKSVYIMAMTSRSNSHTSVFSLSLHQLFFEG